MEMTLDEYYRRTFTSYYIHLDNQGKMKEGKGIIPYGICKNTEKKLKDYLKTHKRIKDIYVEVIYSNKAKDIQRIYFITKAKYENIHIGL